MLNFTVTISVYRNDSPIFFKQAIESILNQTLPPNEIIIAIDGELSNDLNLILNDYKNCESIKFLKFKQNVGLGKSRHESILISQNDIIAVMDSDDIAHPKRFELQINFLKLNNNIDIVGGYIEEFNTDIGDLKIVREVPLSHDKIKALSKWRQSVNHVTIMFKKDAYLKSGGYRGLRKTEDFDLFYRMFNNKLIFANIPEILVFVRFSQDQFIRRRGFSYLKEEVQVFNNMIKSGYINIFQYLCNIIIRIPLRIMPSVFLKNFYYIFLRKKSNL